MQSYPYPTSRSSSSSTSIASLPPSSSAVSSSSSAIRCCTCYYQEHDRCNGRTALNCRPRDCSDGIDNDKDGLIDAKDSGCFTGFGYVDESELPGYQPSDCAVAPGGACISRHLALCQDTTRPEFAGCDQIRTLPKGDIQPVPPEWKCSIHKPIEFGHEIPGVCTGVVERVEHTLNCTDAGCDIEFKNAGCGAAQNLTAWRTCIPNFQALMAKRGVDVLVVEAEQMTHIIDQCTSTVRFEITQSGVNETYGACLFGNRCPQSGQTYRCTYQSSPLIEKNGICCNGPNGPTTMEDTFGGVCPNFCRTGRGCTTPGATQSCVDFPAGTTARTLACCAQFGGALRLEEGTACTPGSYGDETTSRVTASSCDAAKKEALAVAQERMATKKQQCDATPGSTFTSSCTTSLHKSSWVPYSCTYDGECTWTCKW